MEVEVSRAFAKDMRGIHRNYHRKIAQIIEELEAVEDIRQIKNMEPCEGTDNAYRIRIGDYRMGIYIENERIKVKRIGKRGDFYNYFP